MIFNNSLYLRVFYELNAVLSDFYVLTHVILNSIKHYDSNSSVFKQRKWNLVVCQKSYSAPRRDGIWTQVWFQNPCCSLLTYNLSQVGPYSGCRPGPRILVLPRPSSGINNNKKNCQMLILVSIPLGENSIFFSSVVSSNSPYWNDSFSEGFR